MLELIGSISGAFLIFAFLFFVLEGPEFVIRLWAIRERRSIEREAHKQKLELMREERLLIEAKNKERDR